VRANRSPHQISPDTGGGATSHNAASETRAYPILLLRQPEIKESAGVWLPSVGHDPQARPRRSGGGWAVRSGALFAHRPARYAHKPQHRRTVRIFQPVASASRKRHPAVRYGCVGPPLLLVRRRGGPRLSSGGGRPRAASTRTRRGPAPKTRTRSPITNAPSPSISKYGKTSSFMGRPTEG
jgi:hypothetical protein